MLYSNAHAHSAMNTSIWTCFLCFFFTIPICPFLAFYLNMFAWDFIPYPQLNKIYTCRFIYMGIIISAVGVNFILVCSSPLLCAGCNNWAPAFDELYYATGCHSCCKWYRKMVDTFIDLKRSQSATHSVQSFRVCVVVCAYYCTAQFAYRICFLPLCTSTHWVKPIGAKLRMSREFTNDQNSLSHLRKAAQKVVSLLELAWRVCIQKRPDKV